MIASLNFRDNDTVFDITEVTDKEGVVFCLYDPDNEIYGHCMRLGKDQVVLLVEWLNKQLCQLETIEINESVEK